MAKFLAKFKNIVITADGISYAIAKEASLKNPFDYDNINKYYTELIVYTSSKFFVSVP